MLKINSNFKKYKIPLISAFVVIGGMFLFSSLTYIPTQTFAVDGSEEQRTLMNIKYMQQMSEQICTNTKENKTKQLIDIRDGKKYWVAKLKDGNCWMTQNLDLDLNDEVILRPETTDVSAKWLPITTVTDVSLMVNNDKRVQSYDPGYYIKTNPTSSTGCSGYGNDGGLGSDSCAKAGWQDVSNLSEDQYDSHYLVGNYYSWLAATAGSGSELTSSGMTAQSSICSKGWKLPNSSGSYKPFEEMLGSYGITTATSGSADSQEYNIALPPLYFMRSGMVYSSYIQGPGSGGWYWSSTITYDSYQKETRPYQLYLYTTSVDINTSAPHCGGMSVRCYVPGGWLTNYPDVDDESVWPDPDFPEPLDSNQANVAITVAPVISIDATSGMSESIDFTQVAEGNITAKVSSNQAYQVLLSTEQSNLEQNPVLANFNIPMVANDTEIIAGVNSWGVKKTVSVTTGGTAGDDTTLTNTLYSPIGIGDDKVLFYKSSGAESKTLVFPVAISVDATLPSGIYSTQVTITAVAN